MDHGLEVIERNVRAQAKLIDDLLDVSRIITGKLRLNVRTTSLGPIVEAAMESMRPAAEAKDITIQLERAPEGDDTVVGDPDRLQQVVWNLVSNAIKFTPGGGRVEIALRADGGSVLLEVSDTGTGIPEDERAKLFERFFRSQAVLDRRVPGSGLGLYICKAIVDAHGGRIAIRSVVDRGTVVLVMLPAPVAVPLETELPAAEPVDAELAASHQLGRR
jgi:signal transduction histidine kinase